MRNSSLQITGRGCKGKLSNGCSKRRVGGVVVTRTIRWSVSVCVRRIKVMGEIYHCSGIKLPSHTMTGTSFFAQAQIMWSSILGVPYIPWSLFASDSKKEEKFTLFRTSDMNSFPLRFLEPSIQNLAAQI